MTSCRGMKQSLFSSHCGVDTFAYGMSINPGKKMWDHHKTREDKLNILPDKEERREAWQSKPPLPTIKANANRSQWDDSSAIDITICRELGKSGTGVRQIFSRPLRLPKRGMGCLLYRDKSIPDTTAHAESFHNMLKRVYSSKQNRYMRTLIEKLMQIEENFFIKFKGSAWASNTNP